MESHSLKVSFRFSSGKLSKASLSHDNADMRQRGTFLQTHNVDIIIYIIYMYIYTVYIMCRKGAPSL